MSGGQQGHSSDCLLPRIDAVSPMVTECFGSCVFVVPVMKSGFEGRTVVVAWSLFPTQPHPDYQNQNNRLVQIWIRPQLSSGFETGLMGKKRAKLALDFLSFKETTMSAASSCPGNHCWVLGMNTCERSLQAFIYPSLNMIVLIQNTSSLS